MRGIFHHIQAAFLRGQQLINTARRLYRSEGLIAVCVRAVGWLRGDRAYFRQITPPIVDYADFVARIQPDAKTLAEQRVLGVGHIQPSIAIILMPGIDTHTITVLDQQTYRNFSVYRGDEIGVASLQEDFVLPIDAGDVLAPHALYEIAGYLRQHPDIDALTVDQDHINAAGERSAPWLKPLPTPENVLSANPLRHGCVFARHRWQDGAQDNLDQFSLRLVREGAVIHRLPLILLHRHGASIPPVDMVAVAQHLSASGLGPVTVTYNATQQAIQIDSQPINPPSLSIIIPSRDHAALLAACLGSLYALTDYPDYEVIIVDNASTERDVHQLYDEYRRAHANFRVVAYDELFNFSAACNRGAKAATGDILVFLNNDTEIYHADWLQRLSRWFAVPGVGVVGPKLLYPDGTIQHAGVAFGIIDIADHLFLGVEEHTQTVFGSDNWFRNVSAVTGACLAIPGALLADLNGFDENYQLLYSDLDLCYRVSNAGYRILYTPDVYLVHHESKTHQRRLPFADLKRARDRFGPLLQAGDPLYHPALSTEWPVPTLRATEL